MTRVGVNFIAVDDYSGKIIEEVMLFYRELAKDMYTIQLVLVK
jgi:hypothetical protein